MIFFFCFQYDGGNIEQRTLGYGCRQIQEAKLKMVGVVISWSNQQKADPIVTNSGYNWMWGNLYTMLIE